MTARTPIGIVMNGVTGRMGYRQHLVRSLLAIRDAGGVPLRDGTVLWPELVLVGRNEAKLRDVAVRHGLTDVTTDLDAALTRDDVQIYFDAQVTSEREKAIHAAVAAGKHIYTEKPTSTTLTGAIELARAADAAGVKHGVVQDKLFLPGLRKLRRLVEGGFFGTLLSFRLNFGYWVFEGDWQSLNRPSWNYRSEDGGGLILDMYPHWRYLIDNVVSPIRSVLCHAEIHIPKRWDEDGNEYTSTAEDAAYGMFKLENGVLAQFTTSWATRPYRDEIGEWQLDGTHGSAVAGLRDCRTQERANTPMPVWNPDIPNPLDFRAGWSEVPDNEEFPNAFRIQWEMFLRHVVEDAPFTWDLLEGAKGVQLAELALQSSRERRWTRTPQRTPA